MSEIIDATLPSFMISIKKILLQYYTCICMYKLPHWVKISTSMEKEFLYSLTFQACSPYRLAIKKKEFSNQNPAEKQYKMPVT